MQGSNKRIAYTERVLASQPVLASQQAVVQTMA